MGHRETAFTIVELLIAVTILAILAIMAVTRLSSALDDARQSTGETDEAALQRIVSLYVVQHDGRGPHLDARGLPDCALTANRLIARTDRQGRIVPDGSVGPYLRQWPANPMCDSATAQEIEFGTAAAPPLSGKTGWYYNTDACRVFLNTARPAGDPTPATPAKTPTPAAPVVPVAPVTPTKVVAPAETATPVTADPVAAPATPVVKRSPVASPAQ